MCHFLRGTLWYNLQVFGLRQPSPKRQPVQVRRLANLNWLPFWKDTSTFKLFLLFYYDFELKIFSSPPPNYPNGGFLMHQIPE